MQRPPCHPGQSIFSGGSGIHVMWAGLLLATLTIGTQAYTLHMGSSYWQTMVFTVLYLGQLMHVMAIRSETVSLFRPGVFSNPKLIVTVALTFFMQLAVIYLPFLNHSFNTQSLTAKELLFCMAVSLIIFIAVEIEKLVLNFRKRK
jgi:Ca2+-transporting ATPase